MSGYAHRDVPPGTKWCPRNGGHVAPLAAFIRDTSRADGCSPFCRDCTNAYRRGRYVPVPRAVRAPHDRPFSTGTRIYERKRSRAAEARVPSVCPLCAKPGVMGEDRILLCTKHRAILDAICEHAQRRRVA